MRYLAPAFYCAVIVGVLLALLARAIYTGAASFLLPAPEVSPTSPGAAWAT